MSEGFLSRAELEQTQLRQLNQLLAAVIPANPFYSRKLSHAGNLQFRDLDSFRRAVPFTSKQELVEDQQANLPYGTNLTFPLGNYTRFHQTSGTSGTPLRWLDTPESWQWMTTSWMEVFRVAEVSREDRVYFAFSFGPFIGFWLAFEAASQLGCLCIPGGGLSSEARLGALLDSEATILCCTPTYALRLAEVAQELGLDLRKSKVKTLVVAGEPGGSIPATRKRIESGWPGVRVFDHHGMTEVGPVTYECPSQPGTLHIIEHAYLAEVVDPNGTPVAENNAGELILTTLGRTGSPLIRYRTGDLVQPGSSTQCICGRHEMCLEGGILGRVDDMVIVRGVNIYPAAVEAILRTFDEIAEYRVHLVETGHLPELAIEIEPVAAYGDSRGLARIVEKKLQTNLSLRIPVRCAATGSLPRFEMKAKRWIRTVSS